MRAIFGVKVSRSFTGYEVATAQIEADDLEDAIEKAGIMLDDPNQFKWREEKREIDVYDVRDVEQIRVCVMNKPERE